ncbi:peptidylprolyl isomerase [Planctomycetota bacterium]
MGVEFRDDEGKAIESVNVGETFEVVLTVEDHQPGPIDFDGAGVFAAFADVTFDPVLALVDGGLKASSTYDLAPSGILEDGFIDEVGGAARSLEPLGREVRDLVSWTMTAVSGGEFGIELGLADKLPRHDSLLYGLNDEIDQSLIQFNDNATIEIIGEVAQRLPIRIEIGGDRFVVYDPETGELSTEAPTDDIRVLQIQSAASLFLPDNVTNLGGDFDVARTNELTKVRVVQPYWGDLSFGNVLPTGLTEARLAEDLKIEGAPGEGGALTSEWVSVDVRFETPAGEQVSGVKTGQQFNIVIDVTTRQPGPSDRRADLSSASIDAMFESGFATVLWGGITSDDFNLAEIKRQAWGIDELTGVTLTNADESDGVQTLARIPAIAMVPGEFLVETSKADDTGNVFQFEDELEPINPFLVDFNAAALVIEEGTPHGSRDLVAFAQAIAASGVTFYGAAWCPSCTAQKELFEDGGRYLPFIEVTNGDRSRNQIGIENNITTYPTWELADGRRHEGMMSLDELSAFTGIQIPTGDQPHLASPKIAEGGTITVLAGSPLHIPLDGYDPNGDPLTYTVTTDDPSIVSGELRNENRRLRISTAGYGDMVFHLFDEEAPRVTERITSLAESEFYDGVTFHRIIDNFMIQGGDPTGSGSGGSDLPDFDDQFDLDLQHNRDGILSMAKAGDDSNNSQFFITDVATRHLDFNHSIFGQLIEGDDVRDAINSTATGPRDQPALPITMKSVGVFNDVENGMLRLFANADAGTTTIHVRAWDVDGNVTSMSFDVEVKADTSNSPPFLRDIPEPFVGDGGVTVNLDAFDAENDPINYDVQIIRGNGTIDFDPETGRLFVASPTKDLVTIRARVSGEASAGFDEQEFEIDFASITVGEPLTIDLLAESDSGLSQFDNVTNAVELQFQIPDAFVGKEIELRVGAVTMASQIIKTPGTVITVDAGSFTDAEFEFVLRDVTADQSFDGFTVTIDRTEPIPIEIPVVHGIVGVAQHMDLQHPEEGTTGFAYQFVSGDPALSVDQDSGEVRWIPLEASAEPFNREISFTDVAGNQTTQPMTFEAVENPDPIINLVGFLGNAGAELIVDDGSASGDLLELFSQDAIELLTFGDRGDLSSDSFPAIRLGDKTLFNVQSLEEIADFVGFRLPTEEPVELTDMTIPTSGAKIIPLDASSDVASVSTAAVGDGDAVNAYVSTGNPHLRLEVAGYGTMVFEIFESHVPGLAAHLSELVQAGHYEGLEFYRVNGDLIQAGDPSHLALPAASPNSVDDEFHRDLRHSQAGMLAMAKMVDDGIGDNFFVTSRAMPKFDFHYSIVGQIVDGEEVQAAIQTAQTIVGGFPKDPIVITAAEMSFDANRKTLFVTADEQLGESDVTVTRGDDVQTFRVTVEQNASNSGPFIKAVATSPIAGTRTVIAEDIEGDAIRFQAFVVDDSGASVSVDKNGVVRVEAPGGFVGTVEVDVMVSSIASAIQVDRFDHQRVAIPVGSDGGEPVSIADLDAMCVAIRENGGDMQSRLDAFDIAVGDVNLDGVFDSADLIRIFAAAEYEDQDSANSKWSTGDFNCDGEFDSSDLVVAFEAATYKAE